MNLPFIGKPYHDNDRDFVGAIDEVRICGESVSGDRVKLEYETQRKDPRLIMTEYGPPEE